MTSVQNLLQRLNGNKLPLILVGIVLMFSSCTPKTSQQGNGEDFGKGAKMLSYKTSRYKYKKEEFEQVPFNFHLFLPFELDNINLKKFNKDDAWRASTPIGFYQGFKLAIDSFSKKSTKVYRLHVYDLSQKNQSDSKKLITDKEEKENSLFIGASLSVPDVEQVIKYARRDAVPVVFPLSSPSPKKNSYDAQITLQGTIDIHSKKIIEYIKTLSPVGMIYLLNPNPLDNVLFTTAFKTNLATMSFTLVSSTTEIDLNQLSRTQTNVVICTSAYKPDIDNINRELVSMVKEKGIPFIMLGRPEWLKLNLNAEYLKILNAHISSSYKVHYKDIETRSFAAHYLTEYGIQPNEYAFKGFDAGCYIMELVSKYGEEWRDHFVETPYKGLRQEFSVKKIGDWGYFNQNVYLLKFLNNRFELSN